jgi:outer membrane protein assembly factor BamB
MILENEMNRYLCFACVLVLGGCASPGPDSSNATSSTENFQLDTGPDGRVYRISSRTGKTSWLDGSTYRDVAEQTMPQLVVGKVYRGETVGITYRYEGGGKLEKWGLDRYMIKPSSDGSSQK